MTFGKAVIEIQKRNSQMDLYEQKVLKCFQLMRIQSPGEQYLDLGCCQGRASDHWLLWGQTAGTGVSAGRELGAETAV
jgi:hypothetical protein